MAVNYGVVNGTRAFLPILLRQDTGTLVNISSVFGLFGFPNQSAYVASKHAVRGFSESLRQELRGSGVRIAVVHPGGVRTNIVRNARWHVDDTGSSDHGLAMERFAAIARTTPERAAKIIQSGIERGDPRIRIGADAVAMDVLVRVAPVRYFSVIDRLEKMTRPRTCARRQGFSRSRSSARSSSPRPLAVSQATAPPCSSSRICSTRSMVPSRGAWSWGSWPTSSAR